jgi:hypothetical protein
VEIWIRPNRRALALGFVLPAVLLIAGLALVVYGGLGGGWLGYVLGGALIALAALVGGVLLYLLRQPRIAYQAGDVLVYAGLAEPLRVPVDVVECFFLGQAGGMIHDAQGREAEVRTVIVRLAESAPEWHHRDVKAALAHWCEGYITVRGTWCEPITPDLMKRLNTRLVQVQRERRAQAEAGA